MDVRCEKCGTEYELDETRLKPGGVTVKCTSCGHMFKIRKRATTNVGVPGVSAPVPRPGSVSGAPPDSGPTGGGGERNWIIRMANGEQRTCRELATLQQWIIQGLVKRDSMISRSGKTWKQLGDIPELAQFFGVAEEATRTRRDSGRITSPQQPQRGRDSKPVPEVAQTTLGLGAVGTADAPRARPRTQPPPPPKALAAHAGPMAPLPSLGGPPANDSKPKAPAPTAAKPTVPAIPPRAPAVPQPVAQPKSVPVVAAPPFSPPPPQPPATTKPATFARPAGPSTPPNTRSTGAWATEDVRPMEASGAPDTFRGMARTDTSDAGFVGQVRPVPTHDAAFVGSRVPRAVRSSGSMDEISPSEILDDDTGPVVPRRGGGGLGKWIALGSLVLIAGAAAAIYVVVVRQPDKKTDPAGISAGADGGAALATIDGGTGKTTVDPIGDDPVASARDALLIDSGPALTAAGKALADAPQDPTTEALRARLITALAQGANDEAAFRDTKAAAALRQQAKKSVAEAMPLAQKAVKSRSPNPADDAMAHIAMADVLRLQGKPTKDVRAQLDRALELAPGDPEARLVDAMLQERDGKAADAKAILEKIEADNPLSGSGDVRPKLRLALLAYARNDAPAAQQGAEDVIGVQADHAVAALLLAKLRDTVATGDPMPPEEDIDAGVKSGSGSGSSSGSSSGSGSGSSSGSSKGTGGHGSSEPSGDYDALLAKADHLAEINCDDAMPYYAKALEAKPNGVAALTGRGYCYIDSKQFSSAHSSFRAALAVSRKYEPALWGIAEAYQQQGLKDKAIEAYQDYLETYPGSSKALKQLEKLGVSSTDGGGGDPPKDPDPPKEDPPKEDPPAEEPGTDG